MPQDIVLCENISFGKSKGEMLGNKGKQGRWDVDRHPIFVILKVDILEMWCVSLLYGMYISFRRMKRGKQKGLDSGVVRKCLLLPEGTNNLAK